MSNKVLVVAAHSDDEALGCGGTIARHVAQGDDVYAVFLADGVSSRPNATDDELTQRITAAEQAQEVLGIKQIFMLGFPDNRLDTIALLDIVQAIEGIIDQVRPNIIYTHHYGDLNVDHRITHQATLTACRPIPGSTVRTIYAFEVLSATEWNNPCNSPFLPNVFVDIGDYVSTKISALECYDLEMRQQPHSRSIKNSIRLSELRGSCVGLYHAEAFMIIRKII